MGACHQGAVVGASGAWALLRDRQKGALRDSTNGRTALSTTIHRFVQQRARSLALAPNRLHVKSTNGSHTYSSVRSAGKEVRNSSQCELGGEQQAAINHCALRWGEKTAATTTATTTTT